MIQELFRRDEPGGVLGSGVSSPLMYRKVFAPLLAILGFMMSISVVPASAHHAPSGFDTTDLITLRGVITEIRWANPHTWFYVDTTDRTGKAVRWRVQGEGPTWLARHGIALGFLKVGDRVTIKGYHSRDTSRNLAAGMEIVLPDGRSFTVGPMIVN
jgi:hypothetical protein